MPDAIFAHPRLAAVYDAFDGARDDLAAYLGIATDFGAHRVLDVGCGTGSLAVLLAEHGFDVIGVDPAEASLAVARSKDAMGRVRWIHSDAATLPRVDADLTVMTGNVAQVFVTDDEWAAALSSIHAAIRPGGHFVFETRGPQARAWEEWAADTTVHRLDVKGVGVVEQRLVVTEIRLPLVSFRYTYRFADGLDLTSDSILRFRDEDELAGSLTSQGFRVVDVREAPDRPGREFVVIARTAESQ